MTHPTVQVGDGYNGSESPHNTNEKFSGATLSLVADKVLAGHLDVSYLSTYYYLAERVRRQIQLYNNLDELYQDYVHLVCRDVKDNEKIDEAEYQKEIKNWLDQNNPRYPFYRLSEHFSHPIHSDNCRMLHNGTCERKLPAYVWREYSAVVYLHDDFKGGEFVLADGTGKKIMTNVEPKCGRLAAFGAGKECLHGVKAVRSGRRCALAQWFTLDHSRRDAEHQKVMDILVEHGLV